VVCVGHVSAKTGERIEMLFRGRLASAPGTMLTPPGEYDGHVLRQRCGLSLPLLHIATRWFVFVGVSERRQLRGDDTRPHNSSQRSK